ncbi:unnamed protein product [Vitrella brassicaformis CCMP3155]|uniref:Uncharacterized protein n=1 Tax=Vitrella brassicaformis (strain CCMP3155) TaxID=1169540 RepID=A0A0G4FKV5_VITBC|nr:unnamed protein product [Vitrella brassicaformis CCMP3155]|eukprot:CEM14005.1 unnamed protein product [Vitrella brassicaformis CCMP3155]
MGRPLSALSVWSLPLNISVDHFKGFGRAIVCSGAAEHSKMVRSTPMRQADLSPQYSTRADVGDVTDRCHPFIQGVAVFMI